MKKLFSCFVAIFCLVGSHQTAFAQSSGCFPMCNNWDDPCCCQGGCQSGLYIGGHVGYAWIHSPDCGRVFHDIEEFTICDRVRGDRGDFAWGVFGGYNFCFWCQGLYLGIEGGYHDNGESKICFKHSRNHFCLESHDWNISATLDYVFCECFDVFIKVGGAKVHEKFKRCKSGRKHCHDNGCHDTPNDCLTGYNHNVCPGYNGWGYKVYSNSSESEWAPVVDVGAGYCFFNCLKATISYRGVFCDHNDNLRDAFRIRTKHDGTKRLCLKRCSTVHSVYGGLVFTF